MALLTAKELVSLIVAVIILVIIWIAWNSVFGLLPESSIVDYQSYESYQRLIKDVNELSLTNIIDKTTYHLISGYSLLLLNPDSTEYKIKEKYPGCGIRSCICLCKDLNCDKADCTNVNNKFKAPERIIEDGILTIKYDLNGVSIDQNNNK